MGRKQETNRPTVFRPRGGEDCRRPSGQSEGRRTLGASLAAQGKVPPSNGGMVRSVEGANAPREQEQIQAGSTHRAPSQDLGAKGKGQQGGRGHGEDGLLTKEATRRAVVGRGGGRRRCAATGRMPFVPAAHRQATSPTHRQAQAPKGEQEDRSVGATQEHAGIDPPRGRNVQWKCQDIHQRGKPLSARWKPHALRSPNRGPNRYRAAPFS
jgi:hypothetical protein